MFQNDTNVSKCVLYLFYQNAKHNIEMKKTLSNIAILALKGLDVKTRQVFADFANVQIQTLNRWIRDNDDELTTASNLSYISGLLKVPEQDLLEDVSEVNQEQK